MTTLRYCPLSRLLLALALGWRLADDLSGTHHGHWSILVYRDGDCPDAPWFADEDRQ